MSFNIELVFEIHSDSFRGRSSHDPNAVQVSVVVIGILRRKQDPRGHGIRQSQMAPTRESELSVRQTERGNWARAI